PDAESEALAFLLADSPSSTPGRTALRAEPPPMPARDYPPPLEDEPPKRAKHTKEERARRSLEKDKRPERAEQRPGVVFEEGWFESVNAGMVGGLLMILIAVVWFVVGLAVGILFFYPPILFVI